MLHRHWMFQWYFSPISPPLPPARTWRPWPRCCWPTRAPSPRCSWRRYLITDNWRLCGIWEYDRSALLQHPQPPGQHSRKRRNIILLKGANKIKLEYFYILISAFCSSWFSDLFVLLMTFEAPLPRSVGWTYSATVVDDDNLRWSFQELLWLIVLEYYLR